MELKQGVQIHGISPEMVLGAVITQSVFNAFGLLMTVTSVVDGKHSLTSLHNSGNAIDVRRHNVPPSVLPKLVQALKDALGIDFDVVLEASHIHIEYQPRTRP